MENERQRGDEREREGTDAVRDAARAERDRRMRQRGRDIGGVPGAVVAGWMIALRDIYDPPPKRDDGIPTVEAPGEPHDVDRDGVALAADDIGGRDAVTVPALDRRPPVLVRRRSRRRWFR